MWYSTQRKFYASIFYFLSEKKIFKIFIKLKLINKSYISMLFRPSDRKINLWYIYFDRLRFPKLCSMFKVNSIIVLLNIKKELWGVAVFVNLPCPNCYWILKYLFPIDEMSGYHPFLHSMFPSSATSQQLSTISPQHMSPRQGLCAHNFEPLASRVTWGIYIVKSKDW